MKVSVLKENLSKSLNTVNHAVNSKGNLEILNNILLKTEDGRLKVEATNLEIGISSFVGGKIEKEGAITIPARLFLDFVNTIPHQKIEIDLKENNILHLKSDNFDSNIKGLDAEDFPIIPRAKNGKKIEIELEGFKKAISLVSFAAAIDESRPVLSGVYINVLDGEMVLAATDSYRLAEVKIKVKNKDGLRAIIPHKALIDLSKILDGESDGEISIEENQVFFKGSELRFTSRLIEGEFPDYEKIIPENFETSIELSRSEFLDAVKATSLFSKENSRNIKISVKSKGEMEISSPESQVGDSLVIVQGKVKGKGGEIIFNSRYVLDILNNLKDETVVFEMNDKMSPGLFKGKETLDYLYIIMPLRG